MRSVLVLHLIVHMLKCIKNYFINPIFLNLEGKLKFSRISIHDWLEKYTGKF